MDAETRQWLDEVALDIAMDAISYCDDEIDEAENLALDERIE